MTTETMTTEVLLGTIELVIIIGTAIFYVLYAFYSNKKIKQGKKELEDRLSLIEKILHQSND